MFSDDFIVPLVIKGLEVEQAVYQSARCHITRDCNLYEHDWENLKYVGGKSVLLLRNIENLHNAIVCSKSWRDAILRVTGKLLWFLTHNMTPHWDFIGFPCPSSNLHSID